MKIEYGLFSYTVSFTWDDAISNMQKQWLSKAYKKKDFHLRYISIKVQRHAWLRFFS